MSTQPYRRFGIGSRLFCMACQGARQAGGEKSLSIRPFCPGNAGILPAFGLRGSPGAPHRILVAEEPFDIQMEYVL